MRGQHLGSAIAAAFGLVYVLVNSAGLPSAVAWALRVAALVVAAAVAIRLVSGRREVGTAQGSAAGRSGSAGPPGRPAPFGRGYWLIVLAEVVAIVVGVRVLGGPLDHPEAGVAWVSVAVGVHFFALAAHFRLGFFHLLGVLVTGCGVAGLALAFAGSTSAVVSLVGGVVPGFVLLGFALWGSTQAALSADRVAHRDAAMPDRSSVRRVE